MRPGVYRDGEDARIRPVASGEPGRPITVLAELAGAVVLSGRWPALGWQVDRGVYYCEYQAPVGYPFEDPFQLAEDGKLLARALSLAAVDRPGRWWVDTAAHRIYVRPSNDRPPSGRPIEYGTAAAGIEFRGVVERVPGWPGANVSNVPLARRNRRRLVFKSRDRLASRSATGGRQQGASRTRPGPAKEVSWSLPVGGH